MNIITWNINGFRSANKKGTVKTLFDHNPEIVCLQEIKMNTEAPDNYGYYCYYNYAQKAGYSGVMVFSKEKPLRVEDKIGIERFDNEGRFLMLEFPTYILINIYIPHGGREKENLDYKIQCIDSIIKMAKNIHNKSLIICTDFNIAHTELDVARYKYNYNNIMFTKSEREKIDLLLLNNLSDSFRYLNKDGSIYSWWPNAFNARERNLGWRIDYIFVSNKLLPKINEVKYLKEHLGSDHCPLLMNIDITDKEQSDFDNLKGIYDLQHYMTNIEYGYLDRDNNIHPSSDDMFEKNYILQTPKQVMNNKIGVCWDQVELERLFFETHHIVYETYFIVYYDGDKCPTHTFLIYNMENEWYWFENSWEKHRGIHQYSTKELLLKDVRTKYIEFIKSLQCQDIYYMNLFLYKYTKPQSGIDVVTFCNHCESGKIIK